MCNAIERIGCSGVGSFLKVGQVPILVSSLSLDLKKTPAFLGSTFPFPIAFEMDIH